jgi:TRAP-type C4-dicarboxylate transport system substrate-binding protein
MRRRRRRSFLGCLAAGAILAAGCSADGGDGGGDKAGGTGDPVTLRMATVNGNLEFTPQVKYFVERVDELSDGNLRIKMTYEVGSFASDAEQQVLAGVIDGTFDLGFVGTHAFDTVGVDSFRALTAPMLLDSYAAESAVFESDIPARMMEGLNDVDLAGVAVLAGALRKPVAVDAPLIRAGDWRGITFSTARSKGQSQAVRALGASPANLVGDSRDKALEEGTIDGFESSLLAYNLNGQWEAAPYLTVNVTLWPQTVAVVANPGVDAALTEAQQGWLREAAEDAADQSTGLVDTDAESVDELCQSGARLSEATVAELDALHQAFTPVYEDFRTDPETQGFIEEIQALKGSASVSPASAVAVPEDCTGTAPPETGVELGQAPAYLNGVYRYTITKQDAIEAGEGDDPEYPMTQTWWFEDGNWKGSGDSSGTYGVDGDKLTIQWSGQSLEDAGTYTFTRGEDGTLTLKPAEPMNPGDAFLMTGKPWIKIE